MTLLWGPFIDQLIAREEVDSLTDPGDVYWPVTDHTGTIRDVGRLDDVSGDFLIASHRVYSSFGRLETLMSQDREVGVEISVTTYKIEFVF